MSRSSHPTTPDRPDLPGRLRVHEASAPLATRRRHAHLTASLISTAFFALIALTPGIARADNLGGLIFVIAIWPIGVLLLLTLLPLDIVAVVKLKTPPSQAPSRAFYISLLILSGLALTAYPLAVIAGAKSAHGMNDPALFAISILPLDLVAAPGFFLALKLRSRAQKLQSTRRHP